MQLSIIFNCYPQFICIEGYFFARIYNFLQHHRMKYYSTRSPELFVSLDDVILNGLADDGGLYLPQEFAKLPDSFFFQAKALSYYEILQSVLQHLTIGDKIDINSISTNLKSVFDFEPKLIPLNDKLSLLDLNTGPTSAFKDYGANTLGVYLKEISNSTSTKKIVLVATSGDTGSAVANAFKDYSKNPLIQVIVLYPKGRVSTDQRKLMTTVGGNITCLEVDGNFDDCQALVKQAMSDESIRDILTSANSINLIRLYGQVAYYIYAYSRISTGESVIFSVPSGNLGNVTAGYISYLLGNPIKKFIVSHNVNDMFTNLVLNGEIKNVTSSIQTISSAMDVYKPSNLERLIVLFGGQFDKSGQVTTMPNIQDMQSMFYVQGFQDEETKVKMKSIHDQYNIEIDPHTAVGLLGVDHSIKGEHPEFANDTIIVLSTAHASKFNDVYTSVIGNQAMLSNPIIQARLKQENIIHINNKYSDLKEIINTVKAGI
jgi:threonine synthase